MPIPLVGTTIGAIVVALATVPVSFPTATIVCIAFIIVWQRPGGYVVQPLVYGRAVNVNPRVTIISLLVGAELLGILGVLLAIPSATAIQIILGEWWSAKASKLQNSALTKGRRADAHAGPRDQRSGATLPDRLIHRLTIRPIAPTTIRMTPTVEMLMPATWAVTANLRIAPTAIANNPMVIV